MESSLRVLTGLSILWAVFVFLYQLLASWSGGKRDYSHKQGDPLKGILYNLTYGMLPSRKETARLNPLNFLAGIAMHTGVFLAIFKLFLIVSGYLPAMRFTFLTIPLFTIALISGIYLAIRRITSPLLMNISHPDDFFAIAITCLTIAAGLLHETEVLSTSFYLFLGCLLFFYMPLGKLRHAVFFFAVRVDYGKRLGYRGVYPVSRPKDSTL